jgi:hypothetical protein
MTSAPLIGGRFALRGPLILPVPRGRLLLRTGFRMRRLAAHLGRRFVLAQTLVNDLAQQIVAGPGEIFHLGD